ncbi:endonuclease/exonuclease/phosphatase family protein [Nocardioides sp. CER19]|uniref:endonuclease/exonuclease/phosphatase family protein n=1 Tax=Nocardioides sp. CER19 TaxID=3038538 RepID=UPI0024482469|nr:endonuclease/exonuclease/phosphatase family protein [Nocardioides sp. CER19]MDH2416519.1 endonuclease/exonuclease/phosphatase family protein [Nocardioides sp. CER19]
MRIATWNLENLFTPNAGTGAPTGQAAYEGKIAALAATIGTLAPDVLAVQEVGSPAALDDLATAIGGTWHTELADPDERSIRCGIISRLPLHDVEQVTAFPTGLRPVQVDDTGTTITSLGRPALKATVTMRGTDVHLISAHLKSKLLSLPDGRFSTTDEDERARYAVYALDRRAAEAAGVRAYATGLLATAGASAAQGVVVAGDLNDEVQAATTQVLLGPPGSEIGTPGFKKPDAGDGQRLWNLATLIPEKERYSRIYRGRRELIDHILVSASLVYDVAAVGAGPAVVPSIADDPDARRNEPGSDHRPIHADVVI